MSKSPLNVAIVGCGRVAGHHCASINEANGVTLAGVCDLVGEKAKAYGEEFHIPFFTDYHQMLQDVPSIDIVAVVTPSGMHHEHAIDIMERYRKHVVVEKPTFMRPGQMQDAYEVADASGVRVFPVFQNRHNKAVARVRQALHNGELGDIRLVNVRVRWCRPQRYYEMAPWRGTFSHDGGCLTNQGIHHVDLLRHLCGEVTDVNATMRTLGAKIEVEDAVVATLRYTNGALGSLEVTTAARPDDFEASISIVGEKGLAQIGGIGVNELQIFTPAPDDCASNSENFLSIKGHGSVYGFGHTQMYRDIVTDVTNETPYPVTREDCLQTLRLLHAFYRSDEAGTWVPVDSNAESTRLGRSNEAISNLYRTRLFSEGGTTT